MHLTPQHEELRRSLIRFIDTEINPNVDKWEENPPFPAHDVFRKMGTAGFLGITKPEKFGGLPLLKVHQCLKARVFPQESEFHNTGRTISLLGNDQIGEAGVFLGGFVDFFAIDEHDDICVLLN